MQKKWTSNPRLIENRIQRLRVDGLFGTYDYDLGLSPSLFDSAGRVLILYGDNGCGKTTLLRLLYHLFASEPSQGHKTYLSRTPFRRVLVQLADGTEVRVNKTSHELVGSYEFSLIDSAGQRVSLPVVADVDGSVREEDQDRFKFRRLNDHLERCNVRVTLLSATRRMSSAPWMTGEVDETVMQYLTRQQHLRPDEDEFEERLDQAMELANQWFRNQALKASTTGTENANNIYASVVRKITSPQAQPGEEVSVDEIEDMIHRLESVQKRHEMFSQLWLTPSLDLGETISVLGASSGKSRQIAYDVLQPYVNGLQAQLDALAELYSLLNTLLTNVNQMLSHKVLAYDLREGMRIISEDGRVLEPRLLSSGEKQLLLILCTIFAYRDKTSTFAIDEPEISFNVKWQRDFVRVVVDCLRGSCVQLLLATHSLELVSQYRGCVLPLRS